MSEPEGVVEQGSFVLTELTTILPSDVLGLPAHDTPGKLIHFAGCAFFMSNFDPNPVTLSLADSDDGVNFVLLPFATPVSSGQLSISIQGLSQAVILFVTSKRYLQISLSNRVPDGLAVQMAQFVPRGVPGEGVYS